MAYQIVTVRSRSSGGHTSAVHLVESPSSFRIKLETLENVVKTVGDRPICIVSICGPGNLGKSFILNYILRCLDAAEKGVDDWIDKANPRKPLEGFRWDWHRSYSSQSDSITKGICIWRKPFILKNARGKEFAVLVLDTQGIYDFFTSKYDNKSIIGLCMLLSSVTILNISTEADVIEEVFKSMKVFCEYGNIFMNEFIEKPFQKLSVLIRDWNESSKYPLGKEGGRKFLKKKLKLDESHPKMKVENEIRNYFTEMDCFLMPDIGGIAKGRNYDGNYPALSKAYKTGMENFVTNLVENDVCPRKIGGKLLTAKDFTHYLHAYVEMLNGKESYFPPARKIFAVTRCIQENVIGESLERYRKLFEHVKDGPRYFTTKAFENAHREGENRALDHFKQNIKDLFGQDPKQANTNVLLGILEVVIRNERQSLKGRNDEKRSKARANAEIAAFDTFRVQFTEKFKKGFQEANYVTKQGSVAKNMAFTEFLNRLCGNESETEIQDLWRPIQIKLDGMISSAVPSTKPKNVRLKRYASRGKSKNDLLQLDDMGEPLPCFSCPICFEVPKGKVFQCKNGHVICEKCCETIKNCPQCRVYLAGEGKIRNRAMEEIIQNLNL